MASVKIPTSFNIDLEFEVASIGVRGVAWLIDIFVRLAWAFFVSIVAKASNFDTETSLYLAYFFLYMLPMALYYLVLEIVMNGQTPGKKVMGIRVRTLNGGRPGISQHLIRWLFRMIETPWIGVNAIIPIASMLRSKYGQRLGDVVAGTIVVSTRTKGSLNETIFRDMSTVNYTPQFPQILKLSDRDMNKIKELMDRAIKAKDQELTAKVSYRVRDVLQIETDMEHLQFLETVLNDYNYYTTR
jgi:uncharacterized RDD family membrane protein YckC